MHIPDGYLGPQTYVPLYIAFVASISIAIRKLKNKLTTKLVPFLGMASAFAFLIMMFNFPIPGGTTGHAVGSAIIALILGPWAAMVSVSVALIIQALVFGDGGITAIGANCFNMAVVMPMIAIGVYRLISNKSASGVRNKIATFLSGYLSINLAAILTAVEFGIQPLIARSASGEPLFAPYSLKVAVPIMALEHLIFYGFIEGIVTMALFSYFYKSGKEMIYVVKQ